MKATILAEGASKSFRRADPNRPHTLQELVARGWRGLQRAETFWALQEVTFQVQPGQMVGVMGRNGAGKSTLLRLLGGVGRPDHGRLVTHGRVGALIDLGAGFHPDLTGRENVMINGVIAGLTRQQISTRFDEIVQFAELEDFIDSPLRTYSSGMQMRLAFAVAVHVDPHILLIDEVLAVGDMAFQQKCLERIQRFKEQGCAILLVSHDIELIGRMCDQALWLEHGRVVENGPATEVARRYTEAMRAETLRRTPGTAAQAPENGPQMHANRFGSLEMQITAVQLESAGQPVSTLRSGQPLQIHLAYTCPEPVEAPIFGVTLTHDDGRVIYDTSTQSAGEVLPVSQGNGCVTLHLERLDLAPGRYYVDVGVYQKEWEYAYDYHWRSYPLDILAPPGQKGVLHPPQRWELHLGDTDPEA